MTHPSVTSAPSATGPFRAARSLAGGLLAGGVLGALAFATWIIATTR